jgi:hypothetical protein
MASEPSAVAECLLTRLSLPVVCHPIWKCLGQKLGPLCDDGWTTTVCPYSASVHHAAGLYTQTVHGKSPKYQDNHRRPKNRARRRRAPPASRIQSQNIRPFETRAGSVSNQGVKPGARVSTVSELTFTRQQFYNAALALVGGSAAGTLAFRLLPPLSPAFRTRRLLALTLRDLTRWPKSRNQRYRSQISVHRKPLKWLKPARTN